jgi:hypothetical protein
VLRESLVATFLEQQFGQMFNLLRPDIEIQVARLRFEQHFGTLNLEQATDVDNDSIDADLVSEYASTHEVD